MSNASTANRVSSMQKLKLRGKIGSKSGNQKLLESGGILPPAVHDKFRTISVNSQGGNSSKHSNRSRVTIPNISNTMVVPNKYKTFQDPVLLGSDEK